MRMSLWPDADQLLLLHAALDDGDSARRAFADWIERIDFGDVMDGGTYRLLPLVYANQTRLGTAHPALPKLAGVYRLSWCEAQRQLRRAAEAVTRFREAGIPVMVNKGLALALLYYPSVGMRPFSDIDLVVPRASAEAAIGRLRDLGWRPCGPDAGRWERNSDRLLTTRHALSMRDDDGIEVDLHWRISTEIRQKSVNDEIWREAVPFSSAGIEALRFNPTWLLFYTIVHGLKPNLMPPLRWIADAAMILRKDGAAIDWAAMADIARRTKLEQRLRIGLLYLRETMGLPVPDEALDGMSRRPRLVERVESRAFRGMLESDSPRRQSRFDMLVLVARLAASEDRVLLPGLGLRWLSHWTLGRGRVP